MGISAEHSWFADDRFGMFVHWGLYALPARHEWVMNRERTAPQDYERYTEFFTADRYDPRDWAARAKAAGMRYVVLTTKHHEGFCLWDSALTDYTIMNTPYGRDAVAEFCEAVREAGLKVGFYHSLIDWHHPDFTVDAVHPLRDGDVEELNAGRDMARYRQYLHGQVRELLTGYGTVDYLFFDFTYPTMTWHGKPGKGPEDWDSDRLLALVRELQPGIIVNDRLGIPGDLVTPEQYQPSAPMLRDGQPVLWEACQTINGSWGYDRDNHDDKPVELLVQMLVDGVSKDGNLLLNVGPTGRGNLDPSARATLAGIADWMELHSRAVYGAGATDLTPPADCRYTRRGDRLYVHLFAWPLRHLHLPPLGETVRYAQFLHDASEIAFTVSGGDGDEAWNTHPGSQPSGTVTLTLPVRRPDVAVPVIELVLG